MRGDGPGLRRVALPLALVLALGAVVLAGRPGSRPSTTGLTGSWQVVGADGARSELVLGAAGAAQMRAGCESDPGPPVVSDLTWGADDTHLLFVQGEGCVFLPRWVETARSYRWAGPRRVLLQDDTGRQAAVLTADVDHVHAPVVSLSPSLPAAATAGDWYPDPLPGRQLPAEEVQITADGTWNGLCGGGAFTRDEDGGWLALATNPTVGSGPDCAVGGAAVAVRDARRALVQGDRLVLLDEHQSLLAALHRASAGTAGQPRCRAADLQLRSEASVPFSSFTGERPSAFLIVNTGTRPCVVEGTDGARATDRGGRGLPLSFGIGGYQTRTYATVPLLLRPGWAAGLVVDRYRCDGASRVVAGTLAVDLSGSGTLRGPTTWTICGPPDVDPGNAIVISPPTPLVG